MKDSKLNLTLYRVIMGRQRISYGGLSIFIYEPTPSLILESYDRYYEDYEYAYMRGVFTDPEILNLLAEYDIWNPLYDKSVEELKKQIDDVKVECFENAYNKKALRESKGRLANLNGRISRLLSAKYSMDHLSCDGVAENARIMWVISQCAKTIDGSPYLWDGEIDLSNGVSLYKSNLIESSDLRYISRNDPWRSMWISSKSGSKLFDRCTTEYTKDQISLCSYSIMYDNIYENPEAPPEEIIEDDDCLDGWMIKVRRDRDKDKKKQSIEGGIKNEKIRGAKEVIIFANDKEEAGDIYSLNDDFSRSVIGQRQQLIGDSAEKVTDAQFQDVRLDLMKKKNEMFNQKFKGK
jgi:frataxin-like iron-binding protein CyaY